MFLVVPKSALNWMQPAPCTGYFIRQFFGDFGQKFRLATKAADLYQGGWLSSQYRGR